MSTHDHPVLGRRTLLKGGTVLAATAALGGGLTGTAHALSGYSRLGNGGYQVPTTLRTGFAPYGAGSVGTHTGEHAFSYDDWFHVLCDSWIDTYNSVLLWQTAGAVRVWFVGSAGVYVPKPGNHGSGNAIDVTAVYHSDGSFADNNYSHLAHAGVAHNRRYAALAWSGRKHLPEVGIVGTEASHANHVHLGRYKNGSSSLLLTRSSWDAWLVQYTCWALLGVPIARDGRWGSQTESYYRTLMSRLGMGGRDPFGSTADLQDLAHTLTAYGVIGQPV